MHLPVASLRAIAFKLLEGYGDAAAGQWEDHGDRFFHLRRRLSPSEAKLTGPVVDVRGTAEAARRVEVVQKWVAAAGVQWLAELEMHGV
jgi:hypothetical protein